MLDHHQGGIGHVDADLDHGGRHQHFDLAAHERRHHRRFLGRLEAPVQQADPQFRQRARERLVGGDGGLQLQLLRLLDQRTHPVHLPPFGAGFAHPGDDFVAPALRG